LGLRSERAWRLHLRKRGYRRVTVDRERFCRGTACLSRGDCIRNSRKAAATQASGHYDRREQKFAASRATTDLQEEQQQVHYVWLSLAADCRSDPDLHRG